MKFTAKQLGAIVWGEDDRFEVIEETIGDIGRWSVTVDIIIRDGETGKHYETYWRRAATEYQEHTFDDVDAIEVEEADVVVQQWVKVK